MGIVTRLQRILSAFLAAILAASAAAHHSTAEFDYTKQVTIQGTVKEVQWTNPHSFIQLLVEGKDKARPGRMVGGDRLAHAECRHGLEEEQREAGRRGDDEPLACAQWQALRHAARAHLRGRSRTQGRCRAGEARGARRRRRGSSPCAAWPGVLSPLLALQLAGCGSKSGEDAPAVARTPDDLLGIWVPDAAPRELTADGAAPPLTEDAAAACTPSTSSDIAAGDAGYDPTTWCAGPGMPRILTMPYPFEIRRIRRSPGLHPRLVSLVPRRRPERARTWWTRRCR